MVHLASFFSSYRLLGPISWHKIIINDMKISQSTLPKVATFNILFIKNIIRLIILYTN